EKGVWYLGDEKGGPMRIASPIRILARVRDRDEAEWGLLLELQDYLGNRKRWFATARLIKPDATELCSELQAVRTDAVPHGDTAFYQTTAASMNPYRSRGSLEDWREKLAARCVGNSRLAFCVSCAFGAPLQHLMEMEGGGVHLRSDSSTGKTTVLRVAASVW